MTNERVASPEESLRIMSSDLKRSKELLAKVGLHDNEVRAFLGHPPVEPEAKPCKHGVIETADVGCRKCLALNRPAEPT